MTLTEAYDLAYPDSSRFSSRTSGSRMFKRADIQAAYRELREDANAETIRILTSTGKAAAGIVSAAIKGGPDAPTDQQFRAACDALNRIGLAGRIGLDVSAVDRRSELGDFLDVDSQGD